MLAACKNSFPIDKFIESIKNCYRTWNPPVLLFSANRGVDPFQILISTLLSSRTKDEVTSSASEKLFKLAKTPEAMLSLSSTEIEKVIYPVGFYRIKAGRILQISSILIDRYNGLVPSNIDALLTLPGVGRKTANLVLSEGFDIHSICVDTHVHRISNRVGYVKTRHPNETELVLIKLLPKRYWKCYNVLLVALGQVICKPISPICIKCPVEDVCARVGIKKSKSRES